MGAVFRLEAGFLDLIAPEAGVEGRRKLDAEAGKRLADWATRYTVLRRQEGAETQLLALGKELYAWLDGGERWLARLLGAAVPPVVVEFHAPLSQDTLAKDFLWAPWELLAGDTGYLAADPVQLFCPLRRLGKTGEPDAPDESCLGVTFMAAAPRGAVGLDYGNEENAILDAAGNLGLDLVVEESGNPDRLAERMAEVGAMQVLHLSCHGRSEPEPLLGLEDEEGNGLDTGPAALIGALPAPRPRLLFLSACQTAAAGTLADPLAMTLVRAGAPAVLGWDGSVYDHEATAFARALYKELARRRRLEEAAAMARQALLNDSDSAPSRDWHLARLWLGPKGGGALVGGGARRWMLAADHGHKAFLDTRGQESPVASRAAFVGRRREVQDSLMVLREGTRAGILIQGMGRLDKSSLAARITHRRPDLEPVVVFKAYDAFSVAQAIREACAPAREAIDARAAELRERPEALEDLLVDVLDGPCQQAPGGKPIVLVIDDLERILEAPAGVGDPWRVAASHVPVLRALLRAFGRARTASRLLLTSRYSFTLPDNGADLAAKLFLLQLPPMDAASARLQALRREQAQPETAAPAGAEAEAEAERRDALVARALDVAGGNPGLQDLLFDLVHSDAAAAAAAALEEMEAYLARGELPGQEEVAAFLEDLTLDRLLDIAGPGARELLRKATLFELPVPREIVAALADGGDRDMGQLMGLGLVDRFEDMVDARRPAVSVNALVRPKAGALTAGEAEALAGHALDALFAAWGGAEGARRPHPAATELTRLALLCDHAEVLEACAGDALAWLDRQFAYRQAANWGRRAVEVLEAGGRAPPLGLLRRTGEACVRVGEVEAARGLYARALERIEKTAAAGGPVDPFEHMALVVAQARLLVRSGEPDAALPLFEQAQELASQQGKPQSVAAIFGDIANLKAGKGEVDEALRLHEERLKVFERLGDVRERPTTLVEIARLKANMGEIDEALRLHEETLDIFERLGDVHERATTLGDIARLNANKGEVDGALRLHEEQLDIFERLGDVRERAVALGAIARLKADKGEVDEALRLHGKRLEVYERLGDVRERAVTLGDIALLKADKGEVDEALRLQTECLAAHRGLGHLDGQGAALWDMARIELDRGNLEQAVPMISEAYEIVERIGRLEGICAVGATFGQILVAGGKRDEGLAVLRRSEAGFRKLQRPADAEQVAEIIRQVEAG
jgi:tetratricopeptide (TPR) repeat protein